MRPDIGAVYLLAEFPDGPIKIGRSTNARLAKRIRALELASPQPLRVLRVFYVEDAPALELHLHERFQDDRLWGEWFEPDKIARALSRWDGVWPDDASLLKHVFGFPKEDA